MATNPIGTPPGSVLSRPSTETAVQPKVANRQPDSTYLPKSGSPTNSTGPRIPTPASTNANNSADSKKGPPTTINVAPLQGVIKIEQAGGGDTFTSVVGVLAWPLIAVLALILFHKHIALMLGTIADRIAKGAPIKGPWGIEIGPTPQTPDQQANKIREEVHEVASAEPNAHLAPENSITEITARYLAAEDLALRAIQSEFNVPVSRNMTTGGQKFDGIFAVGDIAYLVEVKLVRSPKTNTIAQRSINQLADSISRVGWRNARGLLAVVYDSNADLVIERHTLQAAARHSSTHIEIRVFNFRELANRFDIILNP